MMYAQVNKTLVTLACGATAVLVIGYWFKYRRTRKSNDVSDAKTHESDSKRSNGTLKGVEEGEDAAVDSQTCLEVDNVIPKEWVRIGRVKELFIYPLKSGRGREIKEALFTEYGLCQLSDSKFPLRDRMFLVYKEETGQFRTGRNYPTLVLVTLSAVSRSQARLEAVGMPSLTFSIPENDDSNSTSVPCFMWWGESLECIDCGDAVARWISRFVTGTNTGLRLGYTLEKRRNIKEGPWQKFTEVYDTLRNEDTGLFSDLASYMLMTESSVNELNQKLDRPVPALQFRPNIVISGPAPFEEDSWEWIKVGENVVIRNVKPCPRFREQRNPKRVKVDGKAPTMGIYCGLYKTGHVNVDDEVYVQYAKNESNSTKDEIESEHSIQSSVSMNGHAVGNGVS